MDTLALAEVDARELTEAARAIMAGSGSPPDEADSVAEHLVGANLAGHDSHGVVRLPRYRTWIETGMIRAGRTLTTVTDAGALLQFDANDGMGQWLARQAMDRAMARAREGGVAVMGLRRAGHVGRVGAFAEQACAAGLVSIHFVNVLGSRLVAPFGSRVRAISTAPFSVGVPRPGGAHFLLDFATSMIAEGKALVAARHGGALPPGALVDAEGRPTADPTALYGDTFVTGAPDPYAGPGALAAFGLHKGSGLALACELLAGALTGNGANTRPGEPFGNGMLSIVLDPNAFDAGAGLGAAVDAFVEAIEALPPADPAAPVLTPGAKERATRAHRLANGIPMPQALWDELRALAGTPMAGVSVS